MSQSQGELWETDTPSEKPERITKKSLYEGFAGAGYCYIDAYDEDKREVVRFTYLTSIYDPGELVGYADLSEDKTSVRVGAVSPENRSTFSARKTRGVDRFSAGAAVIEFQKMRRRLVAEELPKSGRLVDRVKAGRK